MSEISTIKKWFYSNKYSLCWYLRRLESKGKKNKKNLYFLIYFKYILEIKKYKNQKGDGKFLVIEIMDA